MLIYTGACKPYGFGLTAACVCLFGVCSSECESAIVNESACCRHVVLDGRARGHIS